MHKISDSECLARVISESISLLGALLQVDTRCKQDHDWNLTYSNPNPIPNPNPSPNSNSSPYPSPNLALTLSP